MRSVLWAFLLLTLGVAVAQPDPAEQAWRQAEAAITSRDWETAASACDTLVAMSDVPYGRLGIPSREAVQAQMIRALASAGRVGDARMRARARAESTSKGQGAVEARVAWLDVELTEGDVTQVDALVRRLLGEPAVRGAVFTQVAATLGHGEALTAALDRVVPTLPDDGRLAAQVLVARTLRASGRPRAALAVLTGLPVGTMRLPDAASAVTLAADLQQQLGLPEGADTLLSVVRARKGCPTTVATRLAQATAWQTAYPAAIAGQAKAVEQSLLTPCQGRFDAVRVLRDCSGDTPGTMPALAATVTRWLQAHWGHPQAADLRAALVTLLADAGLLEDALRVARTGEAQVLGTPAEVSWARATATVLRRLGRWPEALQVLLGVAVDHRTDLALLTDALETCERPHDRAAALQILALLPKDGTLAQPPPAVFSTLYWVARQAAASDDASVVRRCRDWANAFMPEHPLSGRIRDLARDKGVA